MRQTSGGEAERSGAMRAKLLRRAGLAIAVISGAALAMPSVASASPGGNSGNNYTPGSTNPGNNFPGGTTPGSTYPGSHYPGGTTPGSSNPGNNYPGPGGPKGHHLPTLSAFTTSPSAKTIVYGGSVTDEATLTGISPTKWWQLTGKYHGTTWWNTWWNAWWKFGTTGTHHSYSTPAGTVSFFVCGPTSGLTSCSSTATPVGTPVKVTGTGITATASSASFTPSSAGDYCFYATYQGINYADSDESSSAGAECFTVTPASLTITASNGSMLFGATPPTITPIYSGFVLGDTTSVLTKLPTCGTTATSSSAVGTYPSTCSGADPLNYSISYVNGTVTVAPTGALIITASSGTMTAGGTPPTITASFSGVKGSDTSTSLTSATTQPTCTTTATSSSAPGNYPTTCSGAVDPNYTPIEYVTGTVTVTAAVTTSSSSGSSSSGTSGSSSSGTSPAAAASSSTSAVSGATTVHTGLPFAGSRPYVAAVGALGLGMFGLGMVRRRRYQLAVRHRR